MEIKSYNKIQLKYDPNTFIKFPPEMKPTEEGSGSFVDVRIGCCICSKGFASTMDARPSKDYYSDFIPLKDIDLRMPYYTKSESLEEDIHYLDEIQPAEIWYVWKNPDMQYVYKLRNMLRILHESDKNTSNGGVADFSGSKEIPNLFIKSVGVGHFSSENQKNYYGSKEIPDPIGEIGWDFNYIDDNEITLCPGCYMWSSFIYPESKEKFVPFDQFDLGYKQWLEEYEDKLIIK
ncbi:hypothetical protein ma672 [Moumouvirus australiensis]|uniref:Uncharacterized protein n=1 Tax=Moumouvirus australiensis TaxID=2109587 RepID=A0A2P1EMF4_9VIRU|nr:hypothetical protein QKC55_gp232 [Moumouvirus australiensis]AVL95059.1 hypothetical protein ma672 [Moumouvirus australiensis]